TWRGMESLYKEGIVKAIGVCNFKVHHLEELKKTADIMPFVNQIECHPGMMQKELVEYCEENQIQIEASSPLGNGQILQNEVLKKIALEKGKTPAQICMRWGIQKEMILIPKTSNTERLSQNIDIFNFELSNEEMAQIDNIPYCGGLGYDSDEVIEFG
ncbi:MAG: aldo/keto reductase, partial [Agathobacter sp.]|nr:aldo/keto reductase [Agathobacter sp.]